MNTELNEDLYIDNISKHEIYSAEEKKFILERLNNDRLQQQLLDDTLSDKTKQYSEKEKSDILEELNDKRLKTQKYEEMKKKRLGNKHIYKFGNREYYKLIGMKREFYIEVAFCKTFLGNPTIVTLHYWTFNELKKKDVLIRTQVNSDKIFISYDAIRVYFRPYTLEKKH